MSYNISDKEQIQVIKDWWKKNGKVIILGIILFLVLNSSVIYMRKYNAQYKTNASDTYTRLISSQSQNKIDEVKLFADELQKKYPRSIYASLGLLIQAKNEVEKGKLDSAFNDLMWIINKHKDTKISQIARLRAARILLSENKPQEALKLVNKIDDDSYQVAIDELKGDIALSMQNKNTALKEYQHALDGSVKLDIKSPLLNMKAKS